MPRNPFVTSVYLVLATAFAVVVFAGPAAAQRLPTGDARGGRPPAADIAAPLSASPGQTLDQMPMSLQVAVDRLVTRADVHLQIQRQGDGAFEATAHSLHYALGASGSAMTTPDGSRWSLVLTAAGRAGEPLPLDLARIEQPQPNELRVVRAGLTEWYLNGRRGLEQGWEIHSRPAGTGRLLLTFAEGGSLQAIAGADDRTLTLGGGLSFAGLQAVDAAGRDLPVRFVPGPGRILQIEVDDRDATYPIVIDPTVFEEETAFVVPVPIKVALSADGNRALVGTWYAPVALSRVGGTWQVDGPPLIATVAGPLGVDVVDPYGLAFHQIGVPADYSEIGHGLALSPDGDTALIAHNLSFYGAVYYFTRTCCDPHGFATWIQRQRIEVASPASSTRERDQFGLALALSSDGSTALISGVRHQNADVREIYLFKFDQASHSWSNGGIVTTGDGVGDHLALSADGNTALISNKVAGGVIWHRPASFYLFEQGEPLLPNTGVSATGVALSGDGTVAAIGPDTGGRVYVYTRAPTGTWQGTWTNREDLNCGLYSAALSGDGNTVFCPGFGGSSVSTVWTRPQGGAWSNNSGFIRPSLGGFLFGAATALSGDGRVAVVISPDGERPSYDPCAAVPGSCDPCAALGSSCPRNQGAVYFFSRDSVAVATVPAGGSLSTDAGTGATAEHPGQVTVTSPTAGSVSLRVTAPTILPVEGFSIVGVQFDISAPVATAARPLRISFELHRSLFCDPILCPDPRLAVLTIQVLRTEVSAGVQFVPNCRVLDGTATGDPCVASRIALANGNAQIVVLTSSASIWNFGLSTAPPLPDHITLSPTTATITAGGSQVYTAQALDAFNNSLGDVTASTAFGISPDGSCTGATCTATAAGQHTVTATFGGLTATATLNVNKPPATFTFQGFFQPIDMSTASAVWNTVKAGTAVPVKWRLTLNGAPVSDPASFAGVVSYPIACPSDAASIDDPIDETATGSSGLQYNGDGSWQFNWKTLSSYKNTCRSLAVKFSDGTTSPAATFNFKLK